MLIFVQIKEKFFCLKLYFISFKCVYIIPFIFFYVVLINTDTE